MDVHSYVKVPHSNFKPILHFSCVFTVSLVHTKVSYFSGQQLSLKKPHQVSCSCWYFVRDPEINLQAKLLYMSSSHHSFYSNHTRHQLSGMAALWEPSAPRHRTTHPCSGSVEAKHSVIDLLINSSFLCIESEATSWDLKHVKGIKLVFTPVWCNYAGRCPSAMCSHSVQLWSTSTQSQIDWTASGESCCCYCRAPLDATPD